MHALGHLALCRPFMKRLVSLSIACLALAAASGCKGPCRQLAEKLCDCALTTADKDSCLQNVSNEDGRIGPTASDNQTCQQLLNGCDCHLINTAEGKYACGLARVPGSNLDAGTDGGP